MNPQCRNRIGRPRTLVGASALIMVIAGCGSATESISESVTEQLVEQSADGNVDVEFDAEAGTYRAESDDGSFNLGGDIPDGWPSDISLPDDLEVISGTDMSDGTNRSLAVTGTTELPLDQILDTYTDELSDWTEILRQVVTSEPVAATIGFERDVRTVLITAAGSTDGAITLSINVTEAGQ